MNETRFRESLAFFGEKELKALLMVTVRELVTETEFADINYPNKKLIDVQQSIAKIIQLADKADAYISQLVIFEGKK